MQIPTQITFKGLEHSDAIEAKILEQAARLERFAERIISCRVVVERATRRHRKGNLFSVHIDVKLPGKELVASRDPERGDAHEDPYIAVRDAFNALRRQLEDEVRRQRGQKKNHEVPPHGIVLSIDLTTGRGIIASSDGREVEFSRNSVVTGDFEQLKQGDEVRFAEAMGEQGPTASTVHLVGKHHIVG